METPTRKQLASSLVDSCACSSCACAAVSAARISCTSLCRAASCSACCWTARSASSSCVCKCGPASNRASCRPCIPSPVFLSKQGATPPLRLATGREPRWHLRGCHHLCLQALQLHPQLGSLSSISSTRLCQGRMRRRRGAIPRLRSRWHALMHSVLLRPCWRCSWAAE